MKTPLSFVDFIFERRGELLELTLEHISLTAISLLIAIAIGIPVGIYLTRNKKLSEPIIGFASIIQTIPSVALLGILLPIFGIGALPAIIALFLYALLPILRNTYIGIEEVSINVKEAAKGVGMSDSQILRQIELPLATPVIFAGVRTATVINVGLATLCALIAAGGLGEFIFRGIQLNNMNMILAGAIPAAVLAIFLDSLLGVLQNYIHKILKPFLIVCTLILITFSFAYFAKTAKADIKAGFVHEFVDREDGYKGLQKIYGLSFDVKELETGLMFDALVSEKVDIISGYSTDGRIKAFDLKPLIDDKKVFPPYYAAPYVRKSTLSKYPVLREVFQKISGKLTDEKMTEMNFKAEQLHIPTKKIAKDFLESLGLNASIERSGRGDVLIGSKNFAEQFIIADIFELLIENYTELDVETKKGLAGTKLCFDALNNGEIDIYPEYTGTALFVILMSDKKFNDKDKLYSFVKEESKKNYDLELLEPLGFNNTWTLIMRKDHAKKIMVDSLSSLKEHLE